MKKIAFAAAVVMSASIFAGVSGTGSAHADETWLALTVNSTNGKNKTAAYWRRASTAEEGWAQGVAACKAEWGSDGTCEQATSSRRCIGLAMGNGSNYYTAWADTASAAYAAAQAKSPLGSSAQGRGNCADGSST